MCWFWLSPAQWACGCCSIACSFWHCCYAVCCCAPAAIVLASSGLTPGAIPRDKKDVYKHIQSTNTDTTATCEHIRRNYKCTCHLANTKCQHMIQSVDPCHPVVPKVASTTTKHEQHNARKHAENTRWMSNANIKDICVKLRRGNAAIACWGPIKPSTQTSKWASEQESMQASKLPRKIQETSTYITHGCMRGKHVLRCSANPVPVQRSGTAAATATVTPATGQLQRPQQQRQHTRNLTNSSNNEIHFENAMISQSSWMLIISFVSSIHNLDIPT